jgi:hypothetical protein
MNANLGAEQQIAFAEAQGSLRRAESLRGNTIARWEVHQLDVQDQLDKLLKCTIDHYEIYAGIQMTPKERLAYFREVSQWFHRKRHSLDRHLANTLMNIVVTDRCWKDWAVDIQYNLEYLTYPREVSNNCLPQNTWTALGIRIPDDIFVFKSFPEAPKPDLGLAPFSDVANRLLGTGSLTLVLITGMIGFGVMGSAISCAVNKKEDRDDQRPWSVVVIEYCMTGISAAIVIFLTVEGGLAIFSSGDLEPNAYALFFACFVGAVYSHVVWQRALDSLDPPPPPEKNPQTKKNGLDSSAQRNENSPPAAPDRENADQ